MFAAAQTEDSIFVVATVPPPPGEADAYSAGTKLQAPPLALMELLAQKDAELAAAGVPSSYVDCVASLEGDLSDDDDDDTPLFEVSQIIEVSPVPYSATTDVAADAPLPRRASSVQTVAWALLASVAAVGACTAAAFAFVL